jgi:hypothetical protein
MHFIGAAFLCISLGTAGGYLMARSDIQIDPPVPKKEVEATPADATAADAKEVRGWRDANGQCVGRRNMTEMCGLSPSTRCTYEGARRVC